MNELDRNNIARMIVIEGDADDKKLHEKSISEIIGRDAGQKTVLNKPDFEDDSKREITYGKLGKILKKLKR